MPKLSLSCTFIVSTKIRLRLTTFCVSSGTDVLIDITADSEEVFWESLGVQAGFAIHRFSRQLGIKWVTHDYMTGVDYEFPTENFISNSGRRRGILRYVHQKDTTFRSHPVDEFVDFLVDISEFDNHEYQVEKLGTIMVGCLKYNNRGFRLEVE